MADSGSQDAPAQSPPVHASRAAADARALLRLNNILACISTGAWSMATPFIPLHLAALGASVAVVGAVLGSSGVVPLLISVHAGAVSDQRGPKTVAKASVVLFAVAGLTLASLHSVLAVAVACTLIGVGNIGFAVSPQAIVAAASTPATRVRDYGYYFLWGSVGAVLGPVIGGLAAGRFGYLGAFALVGLLMLPGFAVVACMRDVSTAQRSGASLATAHTFAGRALSQPGVGAILFITFMVACGQQLQQSFYPLYLNKVGLSATLIGIVIAATSLSSILVRSFLSRSVATFGYVPLLLGATALSALSLGITPLMRRFWPLMFVSALMGVSSGFTQPLTMSLAIESVGAQLWGMAIGLRQSVQRLAQVASPVVFGVIITSSGIGSAFFIGALTLAGAIPIMARWAGHLRRTPIASPPAASAATDGTKPSAR